MLLKLCGKHSPFVSGVILCALVCTTEGWIRKPLKLELTTGISTSTSTSTSTASQGLNLDVIESTEPMSRERKTKATPAGGRTSADTGEALGSKTTIGTQPYSTAKSRKPPKVTSKVAMKDSSYELSQFLKTPLDSGCYKFTQITERVIDGRCESQVSSLQQCLESCAEDPQCEYAQFNQTSSLHGNYCLW